MAQGAESVTQEVRYHKAEPISPSAPPASATHSPDHEAKASEDVVLKCKLETQAMVLDEAGRLNLLFLSLVCETVPRMEQCQVVHILDIPFLEIRIDAKLFSEEVQCI